MKLKAINAALVALIALTLAGCGGGGGGGGGGTTVTVSGVAAAGLINNATVKIFSVDGSGNKSATPLPTTPALVTTANGNYTCTIDYAGMVVVEISTDGTYTDEATGATNTHLTKPLRASFNVPAGTTTVSSAVTPLTELAVRNLEKDGKKFLKNDVESANNLIGSLLAGGTNIITTLPVDINSPGQATDAQKNYTLLLAAVSEKQKSDSTSLDAVLTGLTATPLSLATSLDQAKTHFPALATSISTPVKVATKATITVSIPTLPAGKQVSAVSLKIQLPAGITPAVLNPLNLNDASGSLSLIGGATGSLSGASFDSATNTITFGNITLTAFGSGDFLVINCTISPSATNVSAGGFSLLDNQVIDTNGAAIQGITAQLSVAFQ